MIPLNRRRFLGSALAAGAATLFPSALDQLFARAADSGVTPAPGFGPLQPDPMGLLDLPEGFHYRALSAASLGDVVDRLTNGDPVPPLHDGMGAFTRERGVTVLVRNHEVDLRGEAMVDPGRVKPYDALCKGGTTTLWVDPERRVTRAFASLSGTGRNCAGGVTPWGSWLSAEECVYMPGERHPEQHDRTPLVRERHGYVFEVDSRAEALVDPLPIRAMGRFYHEAVAVDPVTAHVYLTEDRSDGLLYRYRPSIVESGTRAPSALRPGDLASGGVLEALRIVKRPAARTHNWGERVIAVGEKLKVDWVRIPEVDPDVDCERDPTDPEPDPLRRKPRAASGSTRAQGWALGAAQFARSEGILAVRGAIYMCATNGGPDKAGQVWKLDLARKEIELVYESSDKLLLEGPDNLCAAPFGDLIVCEDHPGRDRVIGITPNGRTYPIARNAQNDSEMAGACFSADGRTLFVNAQQPGTTFAIWGPWDKRGA